MHSSPLTVSTVLGLIHIFSGQFSLVDLKLAEIKHLERFSICTGQNIEFYFGSIQPPPLGNVYFSLFSSFLLSRLCVSVLLCRVYIMDPLEVGICH